MFAYQGRERKNALRERKSVCIGITRGGRARALKPEGSRGREKSPGLLVVEIEFKKGGASGVKWGMALACLSWIEITVKCCSRDKEEWKGKAR